MKKADLLEKQAMAIKDIANFGLYLTESDNVTGEVIDAWKLLCEWIKKEIGDNDG